MYDVTASKRTLTTSALPHFQSKTYIETIAYCYLLCFFEGRIILNEVVSLDDLTQFHFRLFYLQLPTVTAFYFTICREASKSHQ